MLQQIRKTSFLLRIALLVSSPEENYTGEPRRRLPVMLIAGGGALTLPILTLVVNPIRTTAEIRMIS